ncbi:MAG: hypothetical protein HYZ45_13255, partial [Burkholderiales bacterium]|nr:hypothetical protein [Burkholderiales bacterium]
MFYNAPFWRPAAQGRTLRTLTHAKLFGVLVLAFTLGMPDHSGATGSIRPPPPAPKPAGNYASQNNAVPLNPNQKPDPDAMLIAIYKDLGSNKLREALAKADALVQAY